MAGWTNRGAYATLGVRFRGQSNPSAYYMALTTATPAPDGTDHGLRVRRVVGAAQVTTLYRVATEAGPQTTLALTDPPALADAPAVGDLCAFGEYDRETLRVLVRDIEPRGDLTARLTLIAEGAGVHTAAQGTIPAYDPKASAAVAIPAPVVTEVRSDTAAMLVTASRTLIERVVFTLSPTAIAGKTMHVLFRPSGTTAPWAQATVQEETPTSVAVIGVTSGEVYDFRLQRTHPDYLASPATTVSNHLVVGRAADPAALQNLTLAAVGGQASLRWDLPADLDVQYGGWIVFRHSPATSGATWANSTSLGRAVNGDQTHVYLPLKGGTYLARAYDSLGNMSAVASITTKQASVLAFAAVDELVEDPTFPGITTAPRSSEVCSSCSAATSTPSPTPTSSSTGTRRARHRQRRCLRILGRARFGTLRNVRRPATSP